MTTIAEPAAPVTDVPALRALLFRVQKAKYDDREIDELVGQLLDGFQWKYEPGCTSIGYWASSNVLTADELPRYTGSIDEAVALIERKLPGAAWQVSLPVIRDGVRDAFMIATVIENRNHWAASAATTPLALIAALLSALTERRAERPST